MKGQSEPALDQQIFSAPQGQLVGPFKGQAGYYLIEGSSGVLSSLGLFETSEQADESTKLVTKWIADENFNTVIPNPPKITSGRVVAHISGVPALV